MKKLIILLLTFICGINLLAQPSLKIVNVDASNFPIMRAEFIAKDATGKEIRTPALQSNSLRIIEGTGSNTVSKPFTIQCVNDTKFSLILTLDKTTSMQWDVDNDNPPTAGRESRMTIAKNSAYTFLDALPGYPNNPRADIALTAFSQGFPQPFVNFYPHDILHDFTFKRDTIKQLIKNKVSANGGGTNFNVALMGGKASTSQRNDIPSILEIASRARYTPVVVFLTDGLHDPATNPKYPNNNAVMYSEFGDSLKKMNGIFYAISVGLTMPDELKNISLTTGGAAYSDKRTQSDIEGVYSDILTRVEANAKFAPCYIEWTAGCDAGSFTLEWNSTTITKATATYTYDVNKLPKLEIVQPKITFLNVADGTSAEQTVTVTARNGSVDFTNPTILDNKYIVSDWGGPFPFTLTTGSSRNVKIKYTADNDNTFAASSINFESSACSGELLNVEKGYIFAQDINCGSSTQGVSTGKKQYTQRFCNNSGADITINSIVENADLANEFIVTNQSGITVKNGTCIDIEVEFTPQTTTGSSAFYIVKTSAGDYQARLLGGGSGLPDIAGAASVTLPNTTCINTSSTFAYTVTNPGVLDLIVSSVQLSNTTDFTILSPQSFTVTPNGSANIIIQFNGAATGTSNSSMSINSNAAGKSNYIVALTAKREATKLTYVENTTVDFGVICPNVPVQRTINIKNDGENIATLSLTPNSTSITATASNNDVAVGGTNQITIGLLPSTTGNFSTTLVVRDQCGVPITINITANVEYPDLTGGPLVMNSTIGNPQTLPLPIVNSKSRPVDVANAVIVDGSGNPIPEFTLDKTAFTVPTTGTSINVTYTPVATNVVPLTGYLVLSGTVPCVHSSTITIIGNPDLATAELSMGKYSGLVGQDIAINVELKNKVKFFESNAKTITYSVAFDETLLSPKPPINPGTTAGGKRTITVTQAVNTANNANETFTLNFTILSPISATSTLLELVPLPQTDNKAAVISTVNGTFSIIPATAKLVLMEAKDLKYEPGVVFDFPIKVDDVANQLVAFNEGFKTTVRFDASILETADNSGTIVPNANYGRDRIVDITNKMNFPTEANKKDNSTQATVYTLATLKLRPMLGMNRTAKIFIENTDVIKGKVNIAADSVEFTLLGICEEGGTRLFDADKAGFQMAQIMPNPVTEQLKIQFNALEKGFHKLWIANTLGENTGVLFDKYFEYGTYSFDYDVSKLPSGTYRVIIESPTQTASQVIQIVK